MKHFLVAILAVLSFLPGEHRFVRAVGCPRRYLRRINGKCYYFSVKKVGKTQLGGNDELNNKLIY